jgi:prophage regulatory protein
MNTSDQALRFLRLPEVSHLTGLGKSTILAWASQECFPKAVRLSPTVRVWMAADVENWIRESYARQRKEISEIRQQNG